MKKAGLFALMAVLIAFVFSGISWAQTPLENTVKVYPSVQGDWTISGTMKLSVSIKGHSAHQTTGFVDYFSFYPDSGFQMTDLDGWWSQSKTKFKVYLDEFAAAAYMEDALGNAFGAVSVEATKLSLSGTISKDGNAIKGKIVMGFKIYFLDLGLSGKITSSGAFSGARASGTFEESDPQAASEPLCSFIEAIGAEVLNKMQSGE